MRLNTLKPSPGSKKPGKRVGRGIGSGSGKTCGRGHKGQRSRSGGFHKVGFEGGQMALQRRLPKRGFRSPKAQESAEVRLHELAAIAEDIVDLNALKAANLISPRAERVKIIASGALDRPVTLRGLGVTKGARVAVESAGGRIEE